MDTETTKQRLASLLLGQPVAPWIRARRPGTSWRVICAELREATKGEIDVPIQTLINWSGAPTAQRVGQAAEQKAAS